VATLFGMEGHKVLLVGCDPKHDTTYKVSDTRPVPTVLGMLQHKRPHDLKLADFFIEGRHGLTCIEAGGPEPGVGCAGRGLSKMFELFENMGLYDEPYDVALYDVLGDVVCGGFAVPIRRSYATEVMVVVSGEIMSLYAANNLCRALVRLQHGGVRLMGLIGNLRGVDNEAAMIQAFAERIGTRVVHAIPYDELILRAEHEHRTVVEHAPDSQAANHFRKLYQKIAAMGPEDGVVPRAMGDVGFDEFVREHLFFLGTGLKAAERPPRGFQPDRFIDWMCRALSGRRMKCESVHFEPEGELRLRLRAGDEAVELLLGPAVDPGETGLDFSFGRIRPAPGGDPRGRWADFARPIGTRIGEVLDRYHVPLFDLLRLDEPEEEFRFDHGLFHWRLGEFLVPGQTRYGGYVYAGERFDGKSLFYRFESARGTVVFRLDMGADLPDAVGRMRHLSLHIAEDERSPEERDDPAHQVERYLGFLLSLCDPPSARYGLPERAEGIVVGSTQDWGSDLAVQFFADPGYDFLTNFYAVFGLRWPVALIFHGDRECSNMGTFSPAPMQSFVEHPMHIRPGPGLSEHVFITDLREADTIMGGEQRLKEALIDVARRPEIRTVVVHDTCLVRVVGDDIRRCIAEVQPEVSVPIVYLDATVMDEAAPFAPIAGFWQELVSAIAKPALKPRPHAVNLVGFGFSDAPHVHELRELLGRMGVELNGCLFPGLEWEDARAYLAASHQVVSPWRYVQESFAGVRRWAGLPATTPPLPFGQEGTRRWLEQVGAAVGVKRQKPPPMDEVDRARLDGLRAEAGGLGVALVLASTQAGRLLDGDHRLGVDLVPLLGDLGFSIHVRCFDPPRLTGARERTDPAAIEAGMGELAGPDARLTFDTFTAEENLAEILRAPEIHLVYSEIRDDPRIRAAGKAQFSIPDLQMGYRGACRTAERLVRRARNLLQERYGSYIRKGGQGGTF
jgi:nitrogenase iron protein NifH